VKEENARLEAEGQPTIPEASVVKMAEDLLPKLRVAEWLDRAEAAQRQMDHLDLRDLRSVIIAGDDSIVARDETAVALNVELKASLVRRQEEELRLWIDDIDASLAQALAIANGEAIPTRDGGTLSLSADTLCVHGDHPDAALRARRLHAALAGAGVRIGAHGSSA
jgi:lactam utilization protein B